MPGSSPSMRTSILICSTLLLHSISLALPSSPSSSSKCPNITPVPVDLAAYQGKWYNIIADQASYRDFLRPDTGGSCVTANYTLQTTKPPVVDVRNCLYERTKDNVFCARGKLTTTRVPGAFLVQINPAPFPGPYNVVGLVGKKEDGYRVALVYSCTELPNGKLDQALFLLSRTPQLKFGTAELWYYLAKFARLGVRLDGGRSLGKTVFFPQNKCKYFDD